MSPQTVPDYPSQRTQTVNYQELTITSQNGGANLSGYLSHDVFDHLHQLSPLDR